MNKKYLKILITIIFILSVSASYKIFFTPEIVQAQSSSNYTIHDLNSLIDQKKSSIQNLKTEQTRYNNNLEILEKEYLTLENQLAVLDNNIAQTELEIKRVNLQSEQVQLEIIKINNTITEKKDTITRKKEHLSEFLRTMNLNDNVNNLTLLLGYDNFSDFFDQAQYTKDFEKQILTLIQKIEILRQKMQSDKTQLQKNQQTLNKLRLSRERQKINLQEERNTKKNIIEKTQDSEFKFQELLAQVRSEKRKLEISLREIENNLKDKLAKQSFDRFQTVDNINFSWPIPYQGITTFFMDKTYPYRRIIGEHSGLDLRTLINRRPTPGMPVRSAASGTIVKIIDNGNFVGNAVYIVHGINVMTAYYHLSRIDVVEDEYVKRSQQIGLSGGVPGKYGAGLSNGAHLHFEIRINGIPVDPLDYLPPAEFTRINSWEDLKFKK